jgi:hypothetical protein
VNATKDLLARLHRHYIKPGPMPGGIFIPECGINGGAQTRADALYVGFTSTSGRLLVGHELKVSRADWRRELDQSGKADFWADNCHQWVIVAPGPEIVPKEEVPHGWGLMYPNARTTTRMDIVIKPTTHADRQPEWNAVRSIMARLDTLRAQHDAEVQQKAREDVREQVAKARVELASSTDSLAPEQRDRLGVLQRLEELVGVEIQRYVWDDDGGAKVGADVLAAALRLVFASRDLGLDGDRYSVQRLERVADGLLKGLADYGDALDRFLELTGTRR